MYSTYVIILLIKEKDYIVRYAVYSFLESKYFNEVKIDLKLLFYANYKENCL